MIWIYIALLRRAGPTGPVPRRRKRQSAPSAGETGCALRLRRGALHDLYYAAPALPVPLKGVSV